MTARGWGSIPLIRTFFSSVARFEQQASSNNKRGGPGLDLQSARHTLRETMPTTKHGTKPDQVALEESPTRRERSSGKSLQRATERAALALALAVFVGCAAPESRELELSALSASAYLDERDFTTLSVGVAAKLPGKLSLWGFSDFHGFEDGGYGLGKLRRSFSEYRLSSGHLGKALGVAGLGVQAEYNLSTPADKSLLRFGMTFRHDFSLASLVRSTTGSESEEGDGGWLQWRVFPVETDGDGGQLSLIYSQPLFDRLILTGFCDLNLNDNGDGTWVIEPQLNLKATKHLWVLLEYRYSGFEKSAGLEGSGWAIGLQVRL